MDTEDQITNVFDGDAAQDFLGLEGGLESLSDASTPTTTVFDRLPLAVTLEVGSVSMTLGDLKAAKTGDVIPLGRKNGDLLDVKVNGELFAKAEVVTVDNCYALRFVAEAH